MGKTSVHCPAPHLPLCVALMEMRADPGANSMLSVMQATSNWPSSGMALTSLNPMVCALLTLESAKIKKIFNFYAQIPADELHISSKDGAVLRYPHNDIINNCFIFLYSLF